MKDSLENYSNMLKNRFAVAIDFAARHRLTVVFTIVGAAIAFALLQTRAYLNPTRNEDRYREGQAKLNFKSIDYTVVEKLQATQDDEKQTVEKNLDEGRTNPFSE
jgi:hypothetical protein